MITLKEFLRENETYEDGLKRALKWWQADVQRLNTTLRAYRYLKDDPRYVPEQTEKDE